MKIKAIINPTSGKRSVRKSVRLLLDKLVSEDMLSPSDIFYTTADFMRSDAYTEVANASPDEYDLILAAGGDGTLHEVVNGVLQNQKNIPIAIYPAGTVNDFSRYLGIPKNIDAFIHMLRNFKIKRVDAGQSGGKFFLNVLAGGIMADICFKVPQKYKHAFGKLAYYTAGAGQIPRLFRGFGVDVTYDDRRASRHALLFIVSNSSSVGGFRMLSPDAKVDDGLLDLCVLSKANPFSLIALFIHLITGKHARNKHILYTQARHISISTTSTRTICIDMDGEMAGEMPVEIRIVPKALDVVVP